MGKVTDEFMRSQMALSKHYCLVLLMAAEATAILTTSRSCGSTPGNFELRADGLLSIVAPVIDDTPVCGVGIFPGAVEEVTQIMRGAPAVQAGVFSFEVHPIRSFPGDALP